MICFYQLISCVSWDFACVGMSSCWTSVGGHKQGQPRTGEFSMEFIAFLKFSMEFVALLKFSMEFIAFLCLRHMKVFCTWAWLRWRRHGRQVVGYRFLTSRKREWFYKWNLMVVDYLVPLVSHDRALYLEIIIAFKGMHVWSDFSHYLYI